MNQQRQCLKIYLKHMQFYQTKKRGTAMIDLAMVDLQLTDHKVASVICLINFLKCSDQIFLGEGEVGSLLVSQ